jgi:FkbM family methyltransferase
MKQRLSFRIGSFLYKNAFPVYKKLYAVFKKNQDASEIKLIRKLVKPGDVVLDIGSNIGFYSELFSELVGEKGLVHCFEPDRENFTKLEKAMTGKKNVVLNNAAVSDRNGELEFFVSHRLNVDHRSYKPEKFAFSYKVKALQIDEYLGNNKKVNFIKMDIQGAEFLALQGMKEVLDSNEKLCIVSEFGPSFIKACSNTSPKEFFDFFSEHKFCVKLIRREKLENVDLNNLSDIIKDEYFENIIAFKGMEI